MKNVIEFKYSLVRLTLQKRWNHFGHSKIKSGEDREGGRKITLFGYYDRLIYENINNWYALRPGNARHLHSQDEFSNEYTLRLVAPDWVKKAWCGNGEYNEVFDYSYFDRYASEKDIKTPITGSSDADNFPLNRLPIFSVLLINCSDQKLGSISNYQNGFTEIIREGVETVKKQIKEQRSRRSLQKIKIGLFLSLGYSEFAVLFSGDSIKDINELIDGTRLRLLGKYASSTYTILGFDDTFEDVDISNERISAAIEFSIRPGNHLDDGLDFIGFFIDRKLNGEFKEQTGKLWNQFIQDFPKRDAKVNSSQTEILKREAMEFGWVAPKMLFGAIDWRWEIHDCDLSHFLNAYRNYDSEHTHILSFGNDSDLFKIVHTKLLLDRRADQIDESSIRESEQFKAQWSNFDGAILEKEYKEFVESYNHLMDIYYGHRRSLRAIQGIKSLYDKVVNSTYGADVKMLSQHFFCDFLVIMTQCMKLFNGANDNQFAKDKFLKMMGDVDSFLQEYIQYFRKIFEPFLFAIYRSDHAFFEGQSLLHPSIGSVSKLLFCYNEVLYLWEKKYCEWEEVEKKRNLKFEERSSNFSYLVTSGGADSTTNGDLFDDISNLFSFNSPKKPSRPLVVMMSEAGLYDIEGTLFKLAHEFSHKRGNRMREQRAQAYIRDLSFMVADKIACQFVNGWLKAKILRNICKIKEFDNYKDYLDQTQPKKFEEWINRFIEGRSNKELVDQDIFERCYGLFLDRKSDLQKQIGKNLFSVLYSRGIQQKIIQDFQANQTTKWYRSHWREKCRKICRDVWELCDGNKWAHYSLQGKGNRAEETLRGQIAHVLYKFGKVFSDDFFLIDEHQHKIHLLNQYFSIDTLYLDESLYAFDNMDGIKEAIEASLNDETASNAWEKLAKECFADCLAVKIMVQDENNCDDPWGKKRGLLSYLRAFLFEVRNPKSVWKINEAQIDPFWIYRIYIAKTLLEWEDMPKGNEFVSIIEEWYETCLYPNEHKGKTEYAETILQAWTDLENAWNIKYSASFFDRYQGLMNYLSKCINMNEGLCDALKEVHIPDLRSRKGTIASYTEFVFMKWINIYQQHKGNR